jgi:hypothetical protein
MYISGAPLSLGLYAPGAKSEGYLTVISAHPQMEPLPAVFPEGERQFGGTDAPSPKRHKFETAKCGHLIHGTILTSGIEGISRKIAMVFFDAQSQPLPRIRSLGSRSKSTPAIPSLRGQARPSYVQAMATNPPTPGMTS